LFIREGKRPKGEKKEESRKKREGANAKKKGFKPRVSLKMYQGDQCEEGEEKTLLGWGQTQTGRTIRKGYSGGG